MIIKNLMVLSFVAALSTAVAAESHTWHTLSKDDRVCEHRDHLTPAHTIWLVGGRSSDAYFRDHTVDGRLAKVEVVITRGGDRLVVEFFPTLEDCEAEIQRLNRYR